MEFSFEPSQAKTPRNLNRSAGSSMSTNDRLQRAIERNRAKQAKRQMASTLKSSIAQAAAPAPKATSLEERKRALQAKFNRSAQLEAEREIVVMPKKTTATRKNVAVSGKVSFSSPVKKSKLNAPVKYLGTSKKTTARKSAKSGQKSKFVDQLVIMGWIAIAILTARLLFSDRGVFDYYAHKEKLSLINHEKLLVEENNRELLKEIKLIETDPKYQKKIVRDNLGFIAKSEYLILFAKGRSPSSTN